MHEWEERFANAPRLSVAGRAEVTIQTKAGIVGEGPYFDCLYERTVSNQTKSPARSASPTTPHARSIC